MKAYKQLYKRLNELSLIISCNLNEINNLEFLNQVCELVPNSRVAIYSGLFEDAKEYYQIHNKFPDFEYVDLHYPELLEELEGEEPAFHYSFSEEFLKLLKRDVILQKINKAVSDDDLELVDKIVASDPLFCTDDKKLKDWDDLYKAYDDLKNLKDPLKLGIKELDEMYRGLCYGTLNILAAPPGKFKTTTMCSIAFTNFSQGKKVLFITLEDSWDIIYFNMATRESYEQSRMLSASKMKIGRLEDEDEVYFKDLVKDCKKKYPTFKVACQETWDDFTPTGLMRLIREVDHELGGLDLVILDHASLLKFYPIKGIKDPKEVVNFYIRFLTNLSISYPGKFSLLVAMQTNREGIKELESGKTGSLTNLAEANEAERSASTVTLIYSGPNQVDSNIINFYPKKNRRGYLTAKPIITFIEPGAYFVGERAIDGNVDLDDLIEGEDNTSIEVIETSKEKKEPLNTKRPKSLNLDKLDKNRTSKESDKIVKKKKIKILNKGVKDAATI